MPAPAGRRWWSTRCRAWCGSTKDALSISERLAKAAADLVSLSESIDTTSAAGNMVLRMLAVLAEFERDVIAERTRAAMPHKKAKGERISREAAYGYRIAADRVVVNPIEQQVVARVAELHAAGCSLREIAADLDAADIRPRSGGCWHPQTVARIAAAAPARPGAPPPAQALVDEIEELLAAGLTSGDDGREGTPS